MKTFWIILTILFAIFMTLYISQATGYYNYEQYQKTELTKDKIAEFERDVKEGKEINVDKYVEHVKYDYTNNASRVGNKISSTIKHYVRGSIEGALSFFGMLLSE